MYVRQLPGTKTIMFESARSVLGPSSETAVISHYPCLLSPGKSLLFVYASDPQSVAEYSSSSYP
jgi:hypothetical protein